MSDRELLEWAAKAAGYEVTWKTGRCKGGEFCGAFIAEKVDAWNPLTDDGDALRLAVKLRLVVHVWDDGEHVSVAKTLPGGDDPEDWGAWHATDTHACGGIEAATRLAIVRAAASIGQQKGE